MHALSRSLIGKAGFLHSVSFFSAGFVANSVLQKAPYAAFIQGYRKDSNFYNCFFYPKKFSTELRFQKKNLMCN